MSRIALVVARAANGVIGAQGGIPWRIPEDLRRFRNITMGRPCIMGRRTWDSLPKKPLPGRLNIIITHDADFQAPGAIVVHSLEAALARAGVDSANEIMVIGGAEIYRAMLPRTDVIHVTEVHANFSGDTYFPAIAPADWCETGREEHVTAEGLRYAFVRLERA